MSPVLRHACPLFLACLTLCHCGGPQPTNLSPISTKQTLKAIPDWFLKPPQHAARLFAVASGTSSDLQVALQKAKTTAQLDLGQQLSNRMTNLTRQFQEETGLREDSELLSLFSSATQSVTNETLIGTRLEQQQLIPEKGIYRAYILMSLPLDQANQRLNDKLKTHQNLYTRFRASEAFETLNGELAKFEADQSQADR
jgi:hypothetical protein